MYSKEKIYFSNIFFSKRISGRKAVTARIQDYNPTT